MYELAGVVSRRRRASLRLSAGKRRCPLGKGLAVDPWKHTLKWWRASHAEILPDAWKQAMRHTCRILTVAGQFSLEKAFLKFQPPHHQSGPNDGQERLRLRV